MLKVQEYLKKFGIEKLKSEFKIKVRDYDDRIVLNYDQIESPTFHEIVDECRNLILNKTSFEVISRSFTRFYNLGEGVQRKSDEPINKMRVSSHDKNAVLEDFDLYKALIQSKVDGSLISLGWDGNQWFSATRSTAFGEGMSNFGRSFKELFESAKEYPSIMRFCKDHEHAKQKTWIFELTSPESRVVTPFSETHVTLIGARNKFEGDELSSEWLDIYANEMGVKRPEQYKVSSYEELIALVNNKPWMDEGVVLVFEQPSGSHKRIKVKNPKFVAIAHMRENGNLSPKSILRIVMANEQAEYLQYFECDRKFFEFVEQEFNKINEDLEVVWNACKDIKDQKEFALTMMAKVAMSFESGILFTARKSGIMPCAILKTMEPKKLSEQMGLKEKFKKNFNAVVDEET
jgi:hypothetical protein